MQIDLFGATEESAIREAAPPVVSGTGAWIPPETGAFIAALQAGFLADAVAILNQLKTNAVSRVLLASGFTLGPTDNRENLMAFVQSDILAAARLRLTGVELRIARLVGQSQSEKLHLSDVNNVVVGDFLIVNGFNYVVREPMEKSNSWRTGFKDGFVAERPSPTPEHRNMVHLVYLKHVEAIAAKQEYVIRASVAQSFNQVVAASQTEELVQDIINIRDNVRKNGFVYSVVENEDTQVEIERVISQQGGITRTESLTISLAEAIVAKHDYFPSVSRFDLYPVQSDSTVTLEKARISKDDAANMKAGMRVVDGEGKEYQAFSARFGYLEAFPIGTDGKADVFAGNSVFFHLDPTTAALFPERRQEPIYLVGQISVDIPVEVAKNTLINNATTLAVVKEIEHGTIGKSGNLRTRISAEDYENGRNRDSNSKPLDVGVAGSGRSFDEGGNVPSRADGTMEQGTRHSGGGTEPAAHDESGDFAAARGDRIPTVGSRDSLSGRSALKLTAKELNAMLVTEMTDDQLLQAKVMFAGGRRAEAIDRQLAKRAIAQKPGENYSVVPGGDGKFTLENDESILGGNGDGSPRQFASTQAATDWAVKNGFGVVPALATQTFLTENSETVKLPATVGKALIADVSGQQARMQRLQALAKQSGVTLDQRVTLQAKAGLAEVALRGMRLAVFDTEDEAVKAIDSGNAISFAARSVMFPGAYEAIKTHVASLQSSVERASGHWDSLTGEEKTKTLVRSGWVTGEGELSFIGKRLLVRDWRDIIGGSKATILKNLPEIAQAELDARLVVARGEKAPALAQKAEDVLALVAAHPLKATMDVQLSKAGNLLSKLTNGSGDIFVLAGRDSVQLRMQVMALLLGKDRVSQAEAGVTAIRDEFYKRAGISTGQTSRGAELEFQNWVGSLTAPDIALVSDAAPVVPMPVNEDRNEYPFGKIDAEHRFHNSRVRVTPELKGDVAWDGTVLSAINGGRLISVKRDTRISDGYEYMPIRITGSRIAVLSVMDAEAAVGQPVASLTKSDDGILERLRMDAKSMIFHDLSADQRKQSAAEVDANIVAAVNAVIPEEDIFTAITLGPRHLAELVIKVPGSMPVVEHDVPDPVRASVQWALGQLRDVEGALDGVQRARGNGHILSLEVVEQAVKQVRPLEILAEFRKNAENNKIDADAFIYTLGGEPNLTRFSNEDSLMIETGTQVAPVNIGDVGTSELELPDGWTVMPMLGGKYQPFDYSSGSQKRPIRRQFDSPKEAAEAARKYVKQQADNAQQKPYTDEPEREAFEHDGVKIYPLIHNGAPYWSVQNESNRTNGKVLGDTLHKSLAEAKGEAVLQAARVQLQVQPKPTNTKDITVSANFDGFFENVGYSVLQAGQAKKALLAPVRMDNETMPSHEFVRKLLADGHSPNSTMQDRIKPMTRMAFFRADNREQQAHEQRIKDGGKKTVYSIGTFEAGAFEFAYASYLTRQSSIADAAQQVVDSLATLDAPVVPMLDYVLTDADRIGLGGLGEKYQDNLRAIQIIRTLEIEKRHAVGDELRSLARYVGWGGLKGVFDPNNKQWARQHIALRSLLTDVEWSAASRSQLDAFYTAPVVAKAMYSAVTRLGFEHGRVLEPSVGVGNFFGLMPTGMRQNSVLHGVELDVLTSQIVAALYPSAKIAKATGFQNYSVPSGYFDMAIGNPPFGSQAITDDKGSVFSGWSIHNYFFAKSIDMLRPGGIMPMVVSHNFLDKLDPHVRQWIARRAELVSGVRLPNSAFKENANTEVVTDVLIFKRLDFENSLGKTELPDWLDTTDVEIENPKTGEFEKVLINNYFINNPKNVLGVNSTTGSMYRANEYTVTANGELDKQLADWVETLPQGIYVPLERSIKDIETATLAVEIPDFVKEGSFFLQDGAILERLQDRGGEQFTSKWEAPNQRAFERMAGMIEIRDVLRHQMRLERSIEDGDIEAGRRNLNKMYDGFVKKNGLLNDQINRRLFLADTESSLIQALEFNYEKALSPAKAEEYGVEPRSSRAVKADIFSRRVLFPPGEIEVVQSAKDALLHSLNNTGGVDMKFMLAAYGKDEHEIIAELGDLLFVDPVKGLVTSDQYLSGDVKTKLAEATKAAHKDFSLSKNVEALAKAIPVDKLPSEIHAAIGAAWIPSQIFMDFAKEISGSNVNFTYLAATAQWLKTSTGTPNFAKNNSEYGTVNMGAVDIFSLTMNSKPPEIKKKALVDGEERWVTDEESTEAVRQQADKIRSHWDSWLWGDGERAEKLTSIYNDKFNRTVERKYDGSHLTFPGMSPSMTLLSHQKNGVWRGLQDRVMLLDQVVGAGKTYEMVAMVMEMRRLGICKKPLIAVPNHLTLQWRSEFYKLYPGANVLAATPQDFDKDNRERFFSKIVTGNWDAVIVGHSSLKKIAVPLEAEMKIINEQFDDIADAILELKQERGDRNVIRDMEKIKSNLEAKMSRLREKGGKKDNVVDFADLGVDALIIDEKHEFKNLFFTTQMTRVAGLGNPAGSGKAFDLFTKIRWLQDTFGQSAPLITATGTPISNSLAEMFTMQRYMQYSSLKANNLHVFDAWAKQYGDVQNVYEVAPSGSGYRLSQRFAKFKNLGSLMGQYRSFADVITLDHLKAQEAALGKTFPVPKLEGGKPLNIIAKRSELQEKFFGIPEIVRGEDGGIQFEVNLALPMRVVKAEDGKFVLEQDVLTDQGVEFKRHGGKRYDTAEEAAYMTALASITPVMVVDPDSIVGQFDNLRTLTRATNGKINALSLTSLANKAGLDYRLIDPNAVDFPESKVNIAIGNMLETAKVWEQQKGVQLVFCDLSVPLSAKAKMASKEKRVYVRDDAGFLTHKKGTLHSIKAYEGLPYFLVQEGNGNSRTFTMYDPVTGHVLKNGLDSKSDAHEMAKRALAQADGLEIWLATRDKSPVIGADEIDEYKNEHTLDADGDAADLEISLDDIEGSTGVAGFSIYDDMKAKLIVGGIPANQIEFIHDHDTPQAKDLLFKRVNAGDVRFLFGSTPKMGAGTNVQSLLVAVHHIDAPWRPSDLEQREGRIIRRGNRLYENDPTGFRIQVNRYATAQTYDTRRWQLLEHKAAGLEQLRNYAGVSEMDDVANEASNSADMKAAASGNPLILKETQLSNEVKKLRLLERAHRDNNFVVRSRMNSSRDFVNSFGPNALAGWETLKVQHDSSQVLGNYGSMKLVDKEHVMKAVDDIDAHISTLRTSKSLLYRGLKFEFSFDEGSQFQKMTMPDGTARLMEAFSRSGVVTRMDNWCNDIDHEISNVVNRIKYRKIEADEMEKNVGAPFDQAENLVTAIAEHGKVQRALMKSNALSAVKEQDVEEFKIAVELQKSKLRKQGFSEAVGEIERSDGLERELNEVAKHVKGVELLGMIPPIKADLLDVVNAVAVSSVADLPKVAIGVAAENAFYYVSGVKGMTSHGSFTSDQARWMSFTRAEASSMQEKNIKPYGATERGVFVGTVAGGRLKIPKPVTPQLPGGDMERFIKVAADSIGDLRKTDVFRVLVESNRIEFQDAIAAFIKAKRPDLVCEVNDVMGEARAEALAKQMGMQVQSSLVSAIYEPIDIDHIKTRMVDALSVNLPNDWIVMNAPRPLLGSKTAEGDFVTGRFYAAIDPKDSMAKKYIEENIKLDARLLVVVSRDTQMDVAMHGNEYRDKYMQRDPVERYEWLATPLEKLRDLTYGELSKLIIEAKGVVQEGLHVGQVLECANGVVTQKIDREGNTVRHDASKLSATVQVGDVVDVLYRAGQGVVTDTGKTVAVGR